MKLPIYLLFVLLLLSLQSFGQHLGLTFQEAEKTGLTQPYLDSMYQSAMHVDTAEAVFKTDIEQQNMFEAYVKLLQDFGKFLSANNFNWERPTKCFNRIYFSADGTIDYFLFNFLGKPTDKPSAAREKQFTQLLNAFIKNYQIAIKAPRKFAQCSPSTYMPIGK